MSEAVLEVHGLSVAFDTPDGLVRAVDGVSYSVEAGRTLGVVGESGCGKTVAALTVMGLTRGPRTRIAGSVRLDGRELLTAPEQELRALRGAAMAMIFQDPFAALHPLQRVGAQVAEAAAAHRRLPRAAARRRAIELLELVGLPDPERRARAFPHELSGGMRQRVVIAIALANEPRLLIADEPTTALDVTVQAQILELIRTLQHELGMAVVLIAHDLGVIAETADEVAVMYAGRIVESAPAVSLFEAPEHPYTWGLLDSTPRLDVPRETALEPIPGRPPSLIELPSGCAFHPRCPYARPHHATVVPPLEALEADAHHRVACLLDPERRRELRRGA